MRAAEELKEARAKFWTNINTNTNETKSCASGAKRGAKEIWRERELMDMELEGRLYFVLGGRRDLRQRRRADERERDDTRYRYKSLLRKIGKSERMVREVRDNDCNARSKASKGISKDIVNMWKELER